MKTFEYFHESGEEVIRDLTADELKQKQIDAEINKAAKAKRDAEIAAKNELRQTLVEKLNLTEDEAKLLLA